MWNKDCKLDMNCKGCGKEIKALRDPLPEEFLKMNNLSYDYLFVVCNECDANLDKKDEILNVLLKDSKGNYIGIYIKERHKFWPDLDGCRFCCSPKVDGNNMFVDPMTKQGYYLCTKHLDPMNIIYDYYLDRCVKNVTFHW